MLEDGRRIQLDLHPALKVDRILFGSVRLKYKRESGAVFVDFPETLQAGRVYTIDGFIAKFAARGAEAQLSCEGEGTASQG
jgi:hypothetical protein